MQEIPSGASTTELEVLVGVTRDLVGVALRSIAPEGVNVPQFRLLLALHEHGPASSAQAARILGLVPSSVTRLADRLEAAGLVARGGIPEHRGVVALGLTDDGSALVERVLQRRYDELNGVLGCLPPQARASAVEALQAIHDLLGDDQGIGAVVL